ncbi:D-alanyl-D-alanine carboxypeptidase, partial [Streptomyces sp. NPDC055078]
MPALRTWQLATGAAVVGLALAAGAVAAAGPWDSGQRKAEKRWAAARSSQGGADHHKPGPGEPAPAPSAPGVLAALGSSGATPHADGKAVPGLGKELGPLLADPGLGPVRTASVVDVATGRQLYGQGEAKAMTPASTIKIATAVAALAALGPDHRIATGVVASPDGGTVTLVGGGDASLRTAGLESLAGRTAKALRERGVTSVRLRYDTSLYRGPGRHTIGVNGNIAPVTALMVDQGRVDATSTGDAERSTDPARDAAGAFGALLARQGVKVTGDPAPGRSARG